jgi:hypothetical protein
MILHGIEVTKFRWNDKEVSEEEYLRLNEEWKKSLEASEPPEKNSRTSKSKNRNPRSGLEK